MPSIHYYRLESALNGARDLADLTRLRAAIQEARLPPEEVASLADKIGRAKQALSQIAVAGTSFRQANVQRVQVGDELEMRPDPYGAMLKSFGDPNGHKDPTAVILLQEGRHVGYVPKDLAALYYPHVVAEPMRCVVTACVGGGIGKNGKPLSYGLRVILPDLDTGEVVIPGVEGAIS